MSTNPDVDLSQLGKIIGKYQGGSRSDLLPALHDAQKIFGYLPESVLTAIGQTLRVPLADIHGVVEFYTMYYSEPVGKRIIRICTASACATHGAEGVLEAACQHAGGIHPGETTPDGAYTVERMMCLGLCDQGPAALVDELPVVGLTPNSVDTLFDADQPTSMLNITGKPRILTRNIGKLPPTDLDQHRAAGVFDGLKHALTTLHSQDVIGTIETIQESQLLGRGGAAFRTGLKWKLTCEAEGEPKYVVCNADESEPGTFKDRILMEGDPYRIIEGMAICGYAIGSAQGYIFLRGEYPLARRILQEAVDKCYEAGLLGRNIFDSGFNFDIEIRIGAGAYICGEETALFEAIEGKRGFPRVKPPFPTTHGLFGKPTVINNVETFGQIADILLNGPEWFLQWGTEQSAGPKLFCVSGHVNRSGLVEAPFGITLNELVNNWCDGFDGKPIVALMGGAAGTFILPEHFDTPLLYETLRPLGASIGSGAVIIFNESIDLRDVLSQLAHFFAHESCGKCFPCQLGTQRQMEILDQVRVGQSSPGDYERLMDIGQTMTDASICGLGQTAGAAVMSALRLWPELLNESK